MKSDEQRGNSLKDEEVANARPARCAGGTGVPPVREDWDVNARAARSTPTPYLYEFSDAMATASDHFFSRFGDIAVHRRNLPHWAADSTLIFITYRLADSMPAEKLRAWQEEHDEWISRHPEPWDETVTREYFDTFPVKLDELLDAGYGSCVLAHEACRRIVSENLLRFDAERYRLHAFVVMPNHVHVLLEMGKKDDLPKVVHGWKSYTAKKINAVIGGTGGVWQKEYYDRLIRDANHYANTVKYIRKNARVAEGICNRTAGPAVREEGEMNARAARSTTSNARAARFTTLGRTGGPPVQSLKVLGMNGDAK